MALLRIRPDDTETFSVETHPRRTIVSSSSGLTGSVYLYAQRSDREKESEPLSPWDRSAFLDQDLEMLRRHAFLESTGSARSNRGSLSVYMDGVRSQQTSVRKAQTVEVVRFVPPTLLNTDSLRKTVVTNVLMPFYRAEYPTSDFSYSNYHSLCFLTASGYATDACLLYPNPRREGSQTLSTYGTGPTGSFSFDFWINPRFTTDGEANQFRAGTILHLTSSYALSLITGSLRDENGFPKGFRLLLQTSESADIPPSIALGSFVLSGASANPQSRFIWASDDNSLLRNRWHHVTVRWGGPTYNLGSGSFVVDGTARGTWVTTASQVQGDYLSNVREPSVLVLGNYYQGRNSASNSLTRFFSADTATKEGLMELDSTAGVNTPDAFLFGHPLNAEVHDLKVYDRYLTDQEITNLGNTGPDIEKETGLRFWVPPFFTRESPQRTALNNEGGVMVSPFQVRNGTTEDPYNPWLAFGCGAHWMNLENHTRDLVTGRYPRTHALTASILQDEAVIPTTCNEILYTTGSNQKRLYLVLPCDNGLYTPRFDALRNLSQTRFVTDQGFPTGGGRVTLRDVFSGSYDDTRGLVEPSGSIIDQLIGPSPENPRANIVGNSLTVLHRTRDNTSNQVVFWDISNLYYGTQIRPGTVVLRDPVLSGSGGRLGMTLRDDSQGNLYRADALTDPATWSSVGNVFYNEGLIVIKQPSLYFFGETSWDLEFQGTQNLHVLKFNLVAKAGNLTTSSNTTYSSHLSASLNTNDSDRQFVYITSVQIHDDNLNVILRTNIAQPVQKRHGDRIVWRPKLDF